MLAIPMSLGLLFAHQFPSVTAQRIQKPLANPVARGAAGLIVLSLLKERQLLTLGLLPMLRHCDCAQRQWPCCLAG